MNEPNISGGRLATEFRNFEPKTILVRFSTRSIYRVLKMKKRNERRVSLADISLQISGYYQLINFFLISSPQRRRQTTSKRLLGEKENKNILEGTGNSFLNRKKGIKTF